MLLLHECHCTSHDDMILSSNNVLYFCSFYFFSKTCTLTIDNKSVHAHSPSPREPKARRVKVLKTAINLSIYSHLRCITNSKYIAGISILKNISKTQHYLTNLEKTTRYKSMHIFLFIGPKSQSL